jgi:hypothetical protein
MNVQQQESSALVESADAAHALISRTQRHLFALIAEMDRRNLWESDGARDMAHWLRMRYGISDWKARRWIAAAHALESLPRISERFASGSLGIDKVVELARFAGPNTEAGLIPWAESVSTGAIRHRGDLAQRQEEREAENADRARSLSWWYEDDGRRFSLPATLPAAQGAIVAKALDRLADQLPAMPGEERPRCVDQRRADALVALASTRISRESDPDRATVVVHVPLEALSPNTRRSGPQTGCALEGGGVILEETARRLACTARLEAVIEDGAGRVVGLGRTSRKPSHRMMRALRHRDVGCRFPGCRSRRFTDAHHVAWWANGGRTDLDNLLLVCSFHHKLVHEYGWAVRSERDGSTTWLRPGGARFHGGPSPPTLAAAGL